jgi:hypothetical protein
MNLAFIDLGKIRKSGARGHHFIYWEREMIEDILRRDNALDQYKNFSTTAMLARAVGRQGNQGFVYEGHYVLKQLSQFGSHYRLHFEKVITASDRRSCLHIPTRVTNS